MKFGNHKIDKFGLSSYLHIHSPVSANFSKFMPVSNPAFHKANATFYVHTFPTGFIEYGQPPKPPIDESTTRMPENNLKFTKSCRGKNIFNGSVKSVMEMYSQFLCWEEFSQLLHQPDSLFCCTSSYSISQRHFITSEIEELFCNI